MGNPRDKVTNDLNRIERGVAFWAYDKSNNKCADWTGYCICVAIVPWAIHAVDIVGCDRIFLNRRFRFEVL